MRLLIDSIGFGVAAGSVIALGAVGFTVQFGISNVLNITYGSLMTVAAYVGLLFVNAGLNIWLALALGGLVIGLVSVLFRRALLAPLARRGTRGFAIIIVTVAAGIILEYLVVITAGPQTHSYGQQSGRTAHPFGLTLTASQMAIIVLAAALMVGLHLLLTRTQLGRAMRATSANRTLAESCGIATDRISDLAWLLSGILCGAAGVALAITTVSFDFTLGPTFLVPMIAAAVLGGVGQPYGAMIGGIVVGVASEMTAAVWDPNYKDVIAFLILIAMLLIRPRGLFGAAWSARRLVA